MAGEFRDIAGKTAKGVARQARRRGVFLSLSDDEVRPFLAQVMDPGARLDAHAAVRPHSECPKVPRRRRVQDGFGGRTAPRKMVGAAFEITAFVSGEWEPDDPRTGKGLYGGPDTVAGRLLIEFNPVTSGCEHILAVTDRHLMLVRIRSGVGRKLGPALVPWWVERHHVPAARRHGPTDFALGFADTSWIRLQGTAVAQCEALLACFPDVPGPWPGDKPPKR
ncbi:hypothetical protein [Actinomadura sp. WMMB 499]|uniref:hypothetical protein n=1 Tax=Actinomadura sp. WMMB 499 TaxID=1219491 RepID=UPI0012455DF8|nr:hypothetical protein [Actinomadura sp. WMMB 499]QFG22299.1 hypothetical protein F7P10_15340 [Actinomadura sp. WMMB 499]